MNDEACEIDYISTSDLMRELAKRHEVVIIAVKPTNKETLRMLTKTPDPDTEWGYNTMEYLKLLTHMQTCVHEQTGEEYHG